MKLCECGECGLETNLAPGTDSRRGWVKGQPLKFILGHTKRIAKRYEVDPVTGCWNWLLHVDENGYGRKKVGQRSTPAHRWMYEKVKGKIPEGLFLDHLCRNRRCVNPEHLQPVSGAENTRRGASTKLTYADVARIRELSAAGESKSALSRMFGISRTQIRYIVQGKSWVNVPAET